MSLFSDKVRDNFSKPKWLGYVVSPDGIGEVGNKICGDTVKMTVKLSSDKSRVQEAKFQTYGCVYSVACAEQVAKMVNGAKVETAEKLDPKAVIAALDGVPSEKAHCAVMAVDAWREALKAAGAGNVINSMENNNLEKPAEQKSLFTVNSEVQLRHRIAELFDEWFVPEMARRGIDIRLEDIDTKRYIISIGPVKSPSIVTNFIQESLRKYFQESFQIRFTS